MEWCHYLVQSREAAISSNGQIMGNHLLLITLTHTYTHFKQRGRDRSVKSNIKTNMPQGHNRDSNETWRHLRHCFVIGGVPLYATCIRLPLIGIHHSNGTITAAPALAHFSTSLLCSPSGVYSSCQPAARLLKETICSRNTPKWPPKLRLWNKGTCDVWKFYKKKRGVKKAWPQQLHFFIVGINLFLRTTNDSQTLLWELYFFSFICLSDINYIFIYRICKKELRNVEDGKVIKN